MLKGTSSLSKIREMIENTMNKICVLQNHDDGGWGGKEGMESDPWTTGEILTMISELQLDKLCFKDTIKRGENWFYENRNSEGLWGLRRDVTDTPGVCWSIIALRQWNVDEKSDIIQSAFEWICKNKNPEDNGWPLYPKEQSTTHSTAQVARTLSRLTGTVVNDHLVRAKDWLRSARHHGGYSTFKEGSEGDITSTHICYAMHGLLDARVPLSSDIIKLPLNKLIERQDEELGTWEDWHEIEESVEGTSYAIYILLRCGVPPYDVHVLKGVEWLINSNLFIEGGGWPEEPESKQLCIWRSHHALYALKTFLDKNESLVYRFGSLHQENQENQAKLQSVENDLQKETHQLKETRECIKNLLDSEKRELAILMNRNALGRLKQGIDSDYLASILGKNRSTVSAYLNNLERRKLLVKEKKGKKAIYGLSEVLKKVYAE